MKIDRLRIAEIVAIFFGGVFLSSVSRLSYERGCEDEYKHIKDGMNKFGLTFVDSDGNEWELHHSKN